jgi:hypothetical protein
MSAQTGRDASGSDLAGERLLPHQMDTMWGLYLQRRVVATGSPLIGHERSERVRTCLDWIELVCP